MICQERQGISIHALLAESDASNQREQQEQRDFYPRSPCGERRESQQPSGRPTTYFYPRSPCGERRRQPIFCCRTEWISIHALLAESDNCRTNHIKRHKISIHALLAESDAVTTVVVGPSRDFYPRSPCGERHRAKTISTKISNFYPRSPCGERHQEWSGSQQPADFYPRSPCGERQSTTRIFSFNPFISIHALLAESDQRNRHNTIREHNFYPRSPCGERLHYDNYNLHCVEISIHALLAESDGPMKKGQVYYINFYPRSPCGERPRRTYLQDAKQGFLSTLSLRRATHYDNYNLHCVEISIHALLAESDSIFLLPLVLISLFLSTLSLRRATVHFDNFNLHCVISIHALLAESDNARPETRRPCAISIHALLAESDGKTLIFPHTKHYFYPRSPCGERPKAP